MVKAVFYFNYMYMFFRLRKGNKHDKRNKNTPTHTTILVNVHLDDAVQNYTAMLYVWNLRSGKQQNHRRFRKLIMAFIDKKKLYHAFIKYSWFGIIVRSCDILIVVIRKTYPYILSNKHQIYFLFIFNNSIKQ